MPLWSILIPNHANVPFLFQFHAQFGIHRNVCFARGPVEFGEGIDVKSEYLTPIKNHPGKN